MIEKKLKKLVDKYLKLSDQEVNALENNAAWKILDGSQKAKRQICFSGFDKDDSIMLKNLSGIYGFLPTGRPDEETRYLCVGNDADITTIKSAYEKGVIIITPEELDIILGTYHKSKIDKYFCFDGIFKNSRSFMQKRVEIAGGHFEASVSKDTDYLVVGDNPGEGKIRRALAYYTEIIDEETFYKLLQI